MIPLIPQPPSYQYPGGMGEPNSVHIQHILRLTINTKGMFTNFDVDIPIVIGTEPRSDANQQKTFNPALVFRSSNGYQSIVETDDLPPTYDSVNPFRPATRR